MSTVHATIDINAPVEKVWDTVMDPNHLKDWVTIHRSVGEVSDQPMRRGSTMVQVLHMRGVSFHVHWTLTDVRSPRHAEWEGQGPAHSLARIRYELSGDGRRTDQVRLHERVRPSRGTPRKHGQPVHSGGHIRA